MQRHFTLLLLIISFLFSSFLGFSQNLPPGWNYTITASFHVIAVPLSAGPAINNVPITPGDYIGVFFTRNDSLICGGASEWPGDVNTAVVAYGDDFLTTIKDGFNQGDTLNWKIYSWLYQQSFDAVADYDPSLPNYDGLFYVNGLSALTSLNAVTQVLVIASAVPEQICIGSSSQLYADSFGGSGLYTYQWSSIPPGFSSNEQDPIVYPIDTTLYIVVVDDGISTATDSATVNVVLNPVVYAGDDTTLCEDGFLPLMGEASYYTTVSWTTNGDGIFENDTLLETVYYPGTNDIMIGIVQITLTALPISPCYHSVTDKLMAFIQPIPDTDAGSDDTICAGESSITSGSVENAYSILWTTSGDGIFDDPVSLNANYFPGTSDIESGNVLLTLTAYPVVPCLAAVSDQMVLVITEVPVANAGPDVLIPYGTTTQLDGEATEGSGNYSWSWTPAEWLVDPSVQDPATLSLEQTTIFTLTVTDIISGCMDDDAVIVYVTGGPLTVTAQASPEAVCPGDSSMLLAVPSGGAGDYTYSWTSIPPGFTSDLPDPIVYPQQTTLYIITVTDGISNTSDTVTVTVNPPPQVDAGPDFTILYGTSTPLHCTVTGGSGYYLFQWAPAFYLIDPEEQNPWTIHLYVSVEFSVIVTDSLTGCMDMDSVLVTVIGHPLQVQVYAEPSEICWSDTAQLFAYPSGGSGEYFFSWHSSPYGFTSNEQFPLVRPMVTTDYIVYVFDGFNHVYGSTRIWVNPIPFPYINVYPDDTVCQNQVIMLDATTEGAVSYYWTPGGYTDPVIWVDTSMTGLGTTIFTVLVTNYYGCQRSVFTDVTFDDCVGLQENNTNEAVMVYPNPVDDIIYVSVKGLSVYDLTLMNIYGQNLLEKKNKVANGIPSLINVIDAPSGIYLIRISSGNHEIYKKIIIK